MDYLRIAPLVVFLICFAPNWAASAESADTAAEIISLQGKGEYREAGKQEWRDASIRQKLAEGDFVRTGDSSRMALLLEDQTQIRLAANSVIQIKQVGDNKDRDTVLKQSKGRSWTQSKKVPNKLTIETPFALAAIRGTDWELVVGEDDSSTLTVLSGEVLFFNDQGSLSVGAGEQAQAQKGLAPVKRLLSNPNDRVQWVSSFTVDPRRYPEINNSKDTTPGSPSAALQAIGDLLRKGSLSAARRAVENLVGQKPRTGTARLLLADFQVLQGEMEAAIDYLRAGAKQYPNDERFDVWRARIQLARDEVAEARSALADARVRNPQSVEVMLATGELERFEGNAPAATEAYHSALFVAPDSPRAWHGLGVVQTEREDVARARDSLNRAISLDPQGASSLGELGTLEVFADNLSAGRAAFTQALDGQADDYVALTGLGLVELKSGNTDEAVTHLLAATLIEPHYARAQTALAVAYYQLGRVPDALFVLSRARKLDPKDPLPDLLESMIHNDLLQPGDALITARRALTLLPYLKSLNQVANDLKGSANLGSALALFGLEDWARSTAQDSYYPFWAGSHLFLADRYAGDFNKKSELFQGFLSDPVVFGASNRSNTLISRPGAYWNIGSSYATSNDFSLIESTVTANGYANKDLPFAYFVEAIHDDTRPNDVAFDAEGNTFTLAFGVRPSYELGLFAYANIFDADIDLGTKNTVHQHIDGRNKRLDLGANYRFGPQSQAWLKIGVGNESSTVDTLTNIATMNGLVTKASKFKTQPEQRDLQFRHTFSASEQHELSWGAEAGWMEKNNKLSEENFFHIGVGIVPSDSLDLRDEDRSRHIWLSDRFHASERLNLQVDLAWQHYTKKRDIDIYRDRIPPETQSFPEDYHQSIVAPRLGATYNLGNGATLRGVYQKWLRPASFNSLAPVATAGIPIDDSLVFAGGTLSRTRGQLDWELSPSWFMTAFADYKKVENLSSPLDGVLNTRADVTNLNRLRQKSITNLAAPDQLEATPVFSRGTVNSAGATFNHVLSRNFAGYFGYINTHSENTSTTYDGMEIPYLPEHRATLGLTWASDQRLIVSNQAVWRSERFRDEGNRIALSKGWDMTLKLHWESVDKRWNVEGYAANLFNRDAEDLFSMNFIVKF